MPTRVSSPLRTLRRARTLTQEDLARIVGVSQEVISLAEAGKRVLSIPVQELIATVLGSSRRELFPEEEA